MRSRSHPAQPRYPPLAAPWHPRESKRCQARRRLLQALECRAAGGDDAVGLLNADHVLLEERNCCHGPWADGSVFLQFGERRYVAKRGGTGGQGRGRMSGHQGCIEQRLHTFDVRLVVHRTRPADRSGEFHFSSPCPTATRIHQSWSCMIALPAVPVKSGREQMLTQVSQFPTQFGRIRPKSARKLLVLFGRD